MKHALKAAALSALAIGASAAVAAPLAPEAHLGRMLEGRTPGTPVRCINQRDIRSAEIIDKTAIVYRVGNKLYVNRPSGASQLRRDDILITESFGASRLCRIDLVRTLGRTALFPTGFVSLGDFVPYDRALN